MTPRLKALVAMSGGVDSSVAAALLVRAGWDVVGVFMRLGSPGESLDELISDEACPGATRGAAEPNAGSPRIHHRGCCSISDAADARLVAAELGVPFYVCNFKKDFGRIIDYFVDEYAGGRTPNPCVRCNDWLKFGKLHDYARQLGCDVVASGHYARVEPLRASCASPPQDSSGARPHRLLRGVDSSKDQSYVLFGVPRGQLSHILFPIGHLPKPEVRDLARKFGLPTFDKPDSQEICFVPDDDYAGLVESRRPGTAAAGRIIDTDGRTLGAHRGQHRFTIGQRRGLSLPQAAPLYVLARDPVANTVTVGSRDLLASRSCFAGEANWLADVASFADWKPVHAKYRYNSRAVVAEVRVLPEGDSTSPSGRRGRFEVRFEAPQLAVAPGQAIVLYDSESPDVVLGGGWIESVGAFRDDTPHAARTSGESQTA